MVGQKVAETLGTTGKLTGCQRADLAECGLKASVTRSGEDSVCKYQVLSTLAL